MKFLNTLLLLLITPHLYSQVNTVTVSSTNNGVLNASYTTTKVYVDELNNITVPLTIQFAPNVTNVTEVELWTNLNNRDRATNDVNADGIHDGIIPPGAPETKPEGYVSGPYPTNGYYNAIPVTSVSSNIYTITTNAVKTGAYRLTLRYKVEGSSAWNYYGGKDHCIVVAPTKARDMVIYEINVFNINSAGTLFNQRGTFETLTNVNSRVNLNYLKGLGVNTLWFQPFHPITWEARGSDDPGSPYSIKNFFEINETATSSYDANDSTVVKRQKSMNAFSNFVVAANASNIIVMIDAPFNHTAPDCELGTPQTTALIANAAGNIGNIQGWSMYDAIKSREARFYSRNDGDAAYSGPASSAANCAVAPDRNDFGKWNDTLDVFYGRYSALVTGYPDAQRSRDVAANIDDTFDYSTLQGETGSNGAITRAVWQYFASYTPYWLVKSGLPANSSIATQTTNGVGAIRADFGQGMPPQFWEYAMNVARSHKWNFIFMTESLDGGNVTLRSARHFEVLNENIVFPLKSANTTEDYKNIILSRRITYGQSLVLYNNTSHDEEGYEDPFEALIRYAVGSTVDGTPMIMYGQEIGTARTFGFDKYEINFQKYVPHFKQWNSLAPAWYAWENNSFGVKNLYPVYAGVNKAREFSQAIRSGKRIFLNTQSDPNNSDANIFAVVKYVNEGQSPNVQDVVFCFVNLRRNSNVANSFKITSQIASAIGLQANRTYNVKNIGAYTGVNNEFSSRRDTFLWGAGLTGQNILDNGIYVSLNRVPASNGLWSTAPYEVQFLKLYDVTP